MVSLAFASKKPLLFSGVVLSLEENILVGGISDFRATEKILTPVRQQKILKDKLQYLKESNSLIIGSVISLGMP
jgi:hypothetical protein